MTAVHEIPAHGRPRATPPALTLTDEHSLLLRQAAIRAKGVLAAISESRWPTAELRALIGCLRAEVLRHAGDKERLPFPAREASGRGTCSAAQLAVTTRDLLARPARHLAAEETLLAAADGPDEPATTGVPQPRPTADAPAERHARPAPEHADRASGIPDTWPFVLPAGWTWVRSADSPLARRWPQWAPRTSIDAPDPLSVTVGVDGQRVGGGAPRELPPWRPSPPPGRPR